MAQRKKTIEEMNPEEREIAFQEWMQRDSTRKTLSKAKRMANTKLRTLYKADYDRFLVQAQVDIKAALASGKMTAADLDKDDEEDPDESPVQTPQTPALASAGANSRPQNRR